MRIAITDTKRDSDARLLDAIVQIAGRDALEQMDAMFERGQEFLREFYETLPQGSLTKRSIERGDSWSETASWGRREGYVEFATELDDMTWKYNGLVPEEIAE